MSKLHNPNFNFEYTALDQKLKPKKASQVNDILVKVIKENIDIVAFFRHHNFNNLSWSSAFSTALKYADAKPVFKNRWQNP